MKIAMHAAHWGTLDGTEFFQMQAGAVFEGVTPEVGFALIDKGIAIEVPTGDGWQPTPRPEAVAAAVASVAQAITAQPTPPKAPAVVAIIQGAQAAAPVSPLAQAAGTPPAPDPAG